jgi:hypothetical protein
MDAPVPQGDETEGREKPSQEGHAGAPASAEPADGAKREGDASDAAPSDAAANDADDDPAGSATPKPQAPRLAARLTPARPEVDEGEGAAYLPRLPWAWILGGLGLVLVFVVVYRIRDTQRTEALRTELLETHAHDLGDLTTRYRTFRERLERWTIEAAEAGEPERWVDPRLRIAGLHGGESGGSEGLYLRLLAENARDAEHIEASALSMETDALTRCLGIAPASARSLYESGQFLMPSFVDGIRDETDLLRLRLYDEQMANAIASDVPVLGTLMQAQYFLLVIQQGENRRDAPVDVYLWDLRTEQQLLRARLQGHGVLIPVRIDSLLPGIVMPPPPEGRPSATSGGAHDCSIAAQIKALTGEAPVSVGSGTAAILRGDGEAAETAEGTPEGTAPTEGTPEGTAPAEATPAPEGTPPAEAPAPAETPPTE